MITGLLIVLAVLLTTLYFTTMHALWMKEEGKALPFFSVDPFRTLAEKMRRLGRRGYYVSTMYGRIIASWGNKKFSSLFFTLFPKAQPAFAKRNNLAGLKDGPSSFFLMSISETKSEQKITRRRRKIV